MTTNPEKATTNTRIGLGIYSLSEAARYVRVPHARLRSWFNSRDKNRGPVFDSDYAGPVLSFHDLVDAQVAAQLRNLGLSMQRIRRVYSALQYEHHLRHPFCSRLLYTDGKNVFVRGAEAVEDAAFVEVLTKQRYFSKILEPFLHTIEYGDSGLAARWRIFNHVVIDPEVYFGKPVVVGSRVTTQHLANELHANAGDIDLVADLYGLPESVVKDAARFEETYSVRRAA